MSAGVYTTEALISSVRLKSLLPSTDDGTSFPRDSDIVSIANNEMVTMLTPWLLNAREGWLLQPLSIQLQSGVNEYTLPQRAAAAQVANILLTDSSGNPIFPGVVEADLEVATQYPYTLNYYGQPTRYFFRGNTLHFIPTPTDSTLFISGYYPQRPNQLVMSTAIGVITSAVQTNGTTYTITCSGGLPANFTTGSSFEVVHANPGFEIVSMTTTGTVSGNAVAFTGTLPTGINVGDSLCLIDTANYPTNVPADVYLGLFAQWIAYKIAEARRDKDGMAAMLKGFELAEKTAKEYMGRRDKLGHRKISSSQTRQMGRPPLFFVK